MLGSFSAQSRMASDQVRSPLRDRKHRRMNIAAQYFWHHGSIHDTQTLYTAHTQLWVHHRRFVTSHLAGT